MPIKSVYHVLHKAGLISPEMEASRSLVRQMTKIPDDVTSALTAQQKVDIMRHRRDVCKDFQKILEAFWNKHYNAASWKVTKTYLDAPADQKPVTTPEQKALYAADFNVSHEGNRNLFHLSNFLQRIDRKEMPTLDDVKWAMMTASTMPETFYSAYELYTGRNRDIDVRSYFPDLNFEGDQ